MTSPYKEMKALKEESNRGIPRGERYTVDGERSILAMARKNDPFYSGQDGQHEGAEWFASLFRRLGFEGRRTHLRFVHYVVAGTEPHPETGEQRQERLPDGTAYANIEANWTFIQEAAKQARNMGLVNPRNVIDRRGPRPSLHAPAEPAPEPGVAVQEPVVWLPSIEVADLDPYISEGRATPTGYTPAHEPSLIEVWAEKDLDDADDPLIESICKEMHANLVVGVGYMTISSVYTMLERRAALDKPLRILYLSDFDFAGKHMPVSPARHVEFALREMDEKPDIRLRQLALTAEQVEELSLPRMPGNGAVELNALMHPSRVAGTEGMLRNAIESLRDESLPRKLAVASMRARARLDEELERRLRWHHRALSLIEGQAREIAESYVEELQDIAERLEEEMAPFEERAERVLLAARRRLEGLEDVELPGVLELGEEPDGAADGWLLDTRRDYFEQLSAYKAHKNGGAE